MARPRSQKVTAVKAKLLARLRDGFQRPGDRFLSTREVSGVYGVSYQTAHRVTKELEAEGFLERRESSGTFVAGRAPRLRGVELWFHPRAREPGRFGAYLLRLLEARLGEAGFRYMVRWAEGPQAPALDAYPVIWEAPGVLQRIREERRYALLLNRRPAPGLTASWIDAVMTDDFSAGVCAAEVLLARVPLGNRLVIVAGPRDDERSRDRVDGFLSVVPAARVFCAGGWYYEHAAGVAKKVFAAKPEGIFCVNDRLAEALLTHCREHGFQAPPLVGHDNAPIAEDLHLTTIETPWGEMVGAAVDVVRKRLGGFSGPARQVLLAQRPVSRLTA